MTTTLHMLPGAAGQRFVLTREASVQSMMTTRATARGASSYASLLQPQPKRLPSLSTTLRASSCGPNLPRSGSGTAFAQRGVAASFAEDRASMLLFQHRSISGSSCGVRKIADSLYYQGSPRKTTSFCPGWTSTRLLALRNGAQSRSVTNAPVVGGSRVSISRYSRSRSFATTSAAAGNGAAVAEDAGIVDSSASTYHEELFDVASATTPVPAIMSADHHDLLLHAGAAAQDQQLAAAAGGTSSTTDAIASTVEAACSSSASTSSSTSFLSTLLYTPVDVVHEFLQLLHDDLNLSWVAVTLVVPWVLKAAVHLPAQLAIQKRMQRDSPKLLELSVAAQELRQKFPLDSERFVKEYKAVAKKLDIPNPWVAQMRPILGMLLLSPFHMSMFFAFRNMTPRFSPSWNVEGFLWCQDLNLPDCYTVLPFLTTFLTMAAVKISASYVADAKTRRVLHLTSFVIGAVTLPVTAYFSAGFNLYCCSNVVSGIGLAALMRQPGFRALFGLKPNTKLDADGNIVLVNPLAPPQEAAESGAGGGGAARGIEIPEPLLQSERAPPLDRPGKDENNSNVSVRSVPLASAAMMTKKGNDYTNHARESQEQDIRTLGSSASTAAGTTSIAPAPLPFLQPATQLDAPSHPPASSRTSALVLSSTTFSADLQKYRPPKSVALKAAKIDEDFFCGQKTRFGVFRVSNHPFRRFLYGSLGLVLLGNAVFRQYELSKDVTELGKAEASKKWCPVVITAAADRQRALMAEAVIGDAGEEDGDGIELETDDSNIKR
ncbi:unnamed protein product [Amoebophrya sp. A120]|nr:unnamed protein product [Amoebophrya sp. A120]|eukprot:GSA120T00000417001.1